MGIPKFYRWTSERYPCLYEKIREYQIPEFDNLYLDMNGIIHNCSHPNDEDIHLRIPEESIFRDIFHYIEFLFRMIKPCQVFFMAIDGVAPRAKMNQQRGRRFRSARVAEEQEAEAIRQGEKLPSEDRFDSNCITPGTEFMARLHEQLKYFVSVKVSTDPLWQRKGLRVYLSGHDVPGEGEHKIMDFIRHIRSQSDYNPETRHCLYGLDADLMMLGLSTHELRFSLLREEVKFTKPKKKKPPQERKPKNKKEKVAPVVAYDPTNVSIFSNDIGVSDSMLKPPTTFELKASSTITADKSFVDAIKIIPPQVERVERNPVDKAASEGQKGAPVPPPSEDLNAKGDYKAPLPEKTTFFLLHLSLFRDYLDEEFKELRLRLTNHPRIKFDLECLIDDWILMNILVGNDFVPHLPSLHIVKGALPMLYRTYMDVLPTLDGYLNESGDLNLKRFEAFITRLSQFDLDQFRETYDDMKYKASKTGKNIVLGEKMFDNFIFEDNTPFEEEELQPISDELKELAKRTEDEIFGDANGSDGGGVLCKEIFPENDDFFSPDDTEEFRLEFLQHKRNYYLTKCEFKRVDCATVRDFAKEYVRAIQWVLLYYYKGVSSWGWFYPSHYGPYSSDLRGFGDFEIDFMKGQPFKPFEQLLAVLPSQSKKLLPSCYQWLMTEETSPILDYYPKKFEQDLNGKRQDWEAVVLIPFIDEFKLLNAMEEEAKRLSTEETFRNSRGTLLVYSYTKDNTGPVKSHRNIFPALEESHINLEKIFEVNYNPQLLPKGLHPKADMKKIYQGFPSLKSKKFESTICKAEVKVFEFYAREESLILSFEEMDEEILDGMILGKKVLGKQVWVNWPHIEAALVTAVYTRHGKYILGRDNIVIKDPKTTDDAAKKTFDVMAKGIVERHIKFRGIRLGTLNCIMYARLLEGRKLRCNKIGKVMLENQWSKIEQPFALKTAIFEEKVTEMFYMDKDTARTYLDLFKKGDQVFYLGDKLFGTTGTVVGHDKGNGSVVVELKFPEENDEANLKLKTGLSQLKSQDFFPPYIAASKCGISSFALSRLTGRVLVSVEKARKPVKRLKPKKDLLDTGSASGSDSSDSSPEDFPALEPEFRKFNIGLDLKFNKTNMEVRGYTSKRDGQWFYSLNTIKLVNEFANNFPDVVELLGRSDKNKDVYNASDIFQEDPNEKAMEIVQWLEDNGVRDLPRIPTNCNVLDNEDIDLVWKYVVKRSAETKEGGQTWTVRPNLLYKPGLDKGCIAPIPNAQFALLDRVICVDRGASIPLGLRGSVVGIQAPPKSGNDDNDEAFKSISADALNMLIIMCDPVPDIFDTPNETISGKKENGDLTELTGSLAKLLGVNGLEPMIATGIEKKVEPKPQQYIRPKLVKLFPYQVINLTQGASNLRQDLKKNVDAVQTTNKNSPEKNYLRNGAVIVPMKSYAQSVAGARQNEKANSPNKVVKILQKPGAAQKNKEAPKIPPLIPIDQLPQSKPTLPWPPQPMNRSITVEQLFAQAAQAKVQKPISNNSTEKQLPQPTQILKRGNATGSSSNSNTQPDPFNKAKDDARIHPEKIEVKKRQPAFADNINQLIEGHPTKSKGNTAIFEGHPTKSKVNTAMFGRTQVFINSSLQKKSPKKNVKDNVPSETKTKEQVARSSEPIKGKTGHSQQNNQLLNLLCQPKNMERVNNSVSALSSIKTGDPNNSSSTAASTVNGHAQSSHQRVEEPAGQAQFQHPVHFVQPGMQLVGHQPVMYVNPNHSQPHNYYVPMWNPLVSAFIPPYPFHSQGGPMSVESPNIFPHPPPPPQHWTQHRNNNNFHRQQRGDPNQSYRQMKGTNKSNVFVPLQVSRSMAVNDGPEPNEQTRKKQPVEEVEMQPPLANASTAQVKPIVQLVEDTAIPASSTLKALLGVSTDTQPETVPTPKKPSRIAANFFSNN